MLSILFLSKLQFKSFESPFVKQPKHVLRKIIYNFHLLVAKGSSAYGGTMLTILDSPDSLLSDELSVDEKSSRDITSSSEDISARYSLSLRFRWREKIAFTRFITSQQRNSLLVSWDTSMLNFYNFGREKGPFSYFSRNFFFLPVIYTHKPNKRCKKNICFIYTLNFFHLCICLCLCLFSSENQPYVAAVFVCAYTRACAYALVKTSL